MPKYRVPFSRGRPHVIFYIDILRQTCTPGAVRRSHQDAADWGHQFSGRAAIVVCQRGQKLSEGTAAWLVHVDVPAEALEGGFEGWKAAKLSLVPTSKLPARDARGRTVWVTRARPKIDRIACPCLIRRSSTPKRRFYSWRLPRSSRSASASMLFPSTLKTCSGVIAANPALSMS